MHGPRLSIALAHDWLCGFRGGEAVLDRIVSNANAWGDVAGLWVMVHDGRPVTAAIDGLPIHTSSLQEIPGAATHLRRHLLPFYPRAVGDLSQRLREHHRRHPIDLLISTSSAAVKGIEAPTSVPHICYCHTPPRYLWSQVDQYDSQGLVTRVGLRVAGPLLRAWDRATAANVKVFAANSHHTAREIERCYGRSSVVVHPPVRTGMFTPDPSTPREDFWLIAGALEPYKRADLAIRAAQLARVPIIIAGGGSQYAPLRRAFEGPGVTFLGRVSDAALIDLYRRARLLIFPQVEDFGIVAVEAQACGLPVLARRAGGALDTVLEGRTGAYFDDPDPAEIAAAAMHVPALCSVACRENALRFSEDAFDRKLKALVGSVIGDEKLC